MAEESKVKFCSKCETTKPISEFNPRRYRVGGLCCWCKDCQSKLAKERYIKNKEHINEINLKWKKENREKHHSINKAWKENNKERTKKTNKAWYTLNKEHKKKQHSDWYQKNKETRSIQIIKWKKNNPEKARLIRLKVGEKIRSTSIGKINNVMSSAIWRALKKNKNGLHWETLTKYSANQLKTHLEKQFSPEMSWDNYGSYWEIDHKIPKSLFHYSSYDDEQFKECWSLNNLQPLPKTINRRKYNKVINYG